MWLTTPGKIVELHETRCMRMGRIDYGGISREACLECIADPRIGDYVMVHVGFAISKVNSAKGRA
jgi:hydrogenase expression/formation protein HypC